MSTEKLHYDVKKPWAKVSDMKPIYRDRSTMYAVVHKTHGQMWAHGSEVDWDNGNFTHWHVGSTRYVGLSTTDFTEKFDPSLVGVMMTHEEFEMQLFLELKYSMAEILQDIRCRKSLDLLESIHYVSTKLRKLAQHNAEAQKFIDNWNAEHPNRTL